MRMTKIVDIKVSSKLYEKDAILNTCYSLTGKCFLDIDEKDGDYTIKILPKEDNCNLEEFELEFKNNLIDNQIRINTNREFKNIRELIVKKAFLSVNKV